MVSKLPIIWKQKWRQLPCGEPFPDESAEWFCHFNPDTQYNSCDVPQEEEEEEVVALKRTFLKGGAKKVRLKVAVRVCVLSLGHELFML